MDDPKKNFIGDALRFVRPLIQIRKFVAKFGNMAIKKGLALRCALVNCLIQNKVRIDCQKVRIMRNRTNNTLETTKINTPRAKLQFRWLKKFSPMITMR